MNEIIITENLTKKFGNFFAVKNLSIKVRKGEIYGFLGLNGAGKTTTIRMLLGLIKPTTGFAYLNGEKVSYNKNNLWVKVGSLVELPHAYPELTVFQNLEIFRRLRLISEKKAVDNVIEKLKLTQYRNQKAKNLSLGNYQRLGLAKALLHNPEILILDEPANGLDPEGIYEIRELLTNLAFNGVTIFISSHILDEISKFATRIGIIHQGKLIKESNIDELVNFRKRKLLVNTYDNLSALSVLTENKYLANINSDKIIEILNIEAIENPDLISNLLVSKGFPPKMLFVYEEDLESYFLRVINNDNLNEKNL
jgi:ABC-2 type transport system ATP-binding protein